MGQDQQKHAQFHDRIARLVAQAPKPDRIVFTGKVTNVEEYLRAADLFVFPSSREGMPNVVLEAMATRLPCILTPFQGLPAEFGQLGRHYRLVPRTPEALAAAIRDCLENRDAAEQMGEDAHTWAVQNLDVETSLDKYARLYHELAY